MDERAYFSCEELAYISYILRSAYKIRTAANEEDEVLEDFIEALKNGRPIYREKEE